MNPVIICDILLLVINYMKMENVLEILNKMLDNSRMAEIEFLFKKRKIIIEKAEML